MKMSLTWLIINILGILLLNFLSFRKTSTTTIFVKIPTDAITMLIIPIVSIPAASVDVSFFVISKVVLTSMCEFYCIVFRCWMLLLLNVPSKLNFSYLNNIDSRKYAQNAFFYSQNIFWLKCSPFLKSSPLIGLKIKEII